MKSSRSFLVNCCALLLLASGSAAHFPDLLERNSAKLYHAVRNEIIAKEYNLELASVDATVKPTFFYGVKYRVKLNVITNNSASDHDPDGGVVFTQPENDNRHINAVKRVFESLYIPLFELSQVEYTEVWSARVTNQQPPCPGAHNSHHARRRKRNISSDPNTILEGSYFENGTLLKMPNPNAVDTTTTTEQTTTTTTTTTVPTTTTSTTTTTVRPTSKSTTTRPVPCRSLSTRVSLKQHRQWCLVFVDTM